MQAVLNRQVLVLNSCWRPVNITTVLSAVCAVFSDRARFVDPESYAVHDFESWVQTWQEAVAHARVSLDRIILCPSCTVVVPELIVSTQYKGLGCGVKRNGRPKFSRRNIFRRDDNSCMYCGKRLAPHALNVDHVVPRAAGGRTEWTNVVLSCITCNQRKRDRTPEQAGMRLVRRPFVPNAADLRISFSERLRRRVRGVVPRSWEEFLGKMYWDVALQDE